MLFQHVPSPTVLECGRPGQWLIRGGGRPPEDGARVMSFFFPHSFAVSVGQGKLGGAAGFNIAMVRGRVAWRSPTTSCSP